MDHQKITIIIIDEQQQMDEQQIVGTVYQCPPTSVAYFLSKEEAEAWKYLQENKQKLEIVKCPAKITKCPTNSQQFKDLEHLYVVCYK